MNKILIGSKAIKYWYPDFNRTPKDTDYAVKDENLFKNQTSIEYLKNPILFNFDSYEKGILKPDFIMTLKVSHLFWDLPNRSWEKHIYDVQFLKEKGCKFIPDLFWKLFHYWESIHGKRKSSNLDMSAKDFFNNAISYHTPHDNLHEILVTHPYFYSNSPTYKKILKEEAEVDVCMDKFNNLSEIDKFNVVFEEIAVMSMENRFPEKMYWKAKYKNMLKKFILNHCKIEEGIWIIQNHKNLLCNIPFNYQEYLNQKTCK